MIRFADSKWGPSVHPVDASTDWMAHGQSGFNLNESYATEAALGFAMLAYNLMSLFRQTVMRAKVQHTLSTLHGLVLAIGGSWRKSGEQQILMVSVPRHKRSWFAGLWANAATFPPSCQ